MATPVGDSYSCDPGGVIAAGRYALPAYARGAAVNEWISLSGTSLNAWSNADKPPNIPYSGMAWREDARQIMLACIGGHGDSSWNGVVSIDMGQDSPGWTIRNAPSLSVNRVTDSAYYTAGLPSSRQTYQNNHWVPQKNRLLLYLHLDPAKVVPMPPNGQDVSQKGHWGTGDLELSLSSQADLDAAKPLILMAYEGRAPAPALGL